MKIKRTFSDKFCYTRTTRTIDFDIKCYKSRDFLDLCIIQGNDIFYKTNKVQEIKEFLEENKVILLQFNCPIVFYEECNLNCNHILNFLKENNLEELIEISYYADDKSFYGKLKK